MTNIMQVDIEYDGSINDDTIDIGGPTDCANEFVLGWNTLRQRVEYSPIDVTATGIGPAIEECFIIIKADSINTSFDESQILKLSMSCCKQCGVGSDT